MPKNELRYLQRFKQCTRFELEIKIKHVHYYAKGNNEEQLNKRYLHGITSYCVDVILYIVVASL